MTPPSRVHGRRSVAAAFLVFATLSATAMPALAQAEASPEAASTAPASSVPFEGAVTLYTSVTQDTVDAVLAAFAQEHPDIPVEVFRAPTGELDARIAAELRSGGMGADVLWVSDPLSLQRYEAEGLLAPLIGDAFADVPTEYRTETSVGTRLLNLVMVAGQGLEPMPASWSDLVDPAYAGAVALPDPGFAGSAFAALGYFAGQDGLGLDFYQQLKDNGAIQVASPVDVMTGVAEGLYKAGISLDKIVADAVADGSPIELIWPESGAIAVYSPAAVVSSSDDSAAAQAFVEFLVSPKGQEAIAVSGWQPVRPDVEWPAQGPAVAPDWPALFGTQKELLEAYRAIFGD
ncbi:MAG TPA: extracellular solute-binding protein [Candidatus Deferrimicrobium sp.]|nr:extracellular solute-binding protein [Candidatus Deferrimicrobium sp.]